MKDHYLTLANKSLKQTGGLSQDKSQEAYLWTAQTGGNGVQPLSLDRGTKLENPEETLEAQGERSNSTLRLKSDP